MRPSHKKSVSEGADFFNKNGNFIVEKKNKSGNLEGIIAAAMNNTNNSSTNNNNNNNSNINSSSSNTNNYFEYFGWVYHLGVNSIGHEYCHLRFLFIRGKYVQMFKRDPHEYPGIKPIRQGVIGLTFMVEEMGRRKVNQGDVYVLRFYNRLDETKKGEIACPTAGEAQKWLEAFDQAKQQAEYELSKGRSTRERLSMETEINLEGHRPRVRRYASGLKKLIRIGQGPELLLRQSSMLGLNTQSDAFERDVGDALEAHDWRCVRTINGIRIFEDVSDVKNGKGFLVKSVGVVDASADTVFEVILNLDRQRRYEWDMLTGDLQQVDSVDGHYDVVYGTYDPKYLTRWQSKRDFVFTRQWFCGQDGTYTILQFPAVHKKQPTRSGYRRTKINPSTWEIRNLNVAMGSNASKCLVALTLEIYAMSWCRWKQNRCSKFEKTVAFALLSQVTGLKEYIEANPAIKFESATTYFQNKSSDSSGSNSEYEDTQVQDEFYDALTAGSSSSDEESEDELIDKKDKRVKLRNISWAISSLALKHGAPDTHRELDTTIPPTIIDLSQFRYSMHLGKVENDGNCWTSPGGMGFMIRGKNYLKDNSKVTRTNTWHVHIYDLFGQVFKTIRGGDPLLKLIGVDWFKAEITMDKVALHPKYLVQSEVGKKLPFILVINLQIPSKPNYSLVLYYAADRPICKDSLLDKFVNGNDAFRDSRFKLIPSIVEGYWMVKRAVGTKACLLGKAVTCNYLRQDNFLEIGVDIGSSSVARSVIGLVLGYVTSLVVDLAILIEAREEAELPEFILGTARLSRVKPDSAVPFEV